MGLNIHLSGELAIAKHLDKFLAIGETCGLEFLDTNLGEVLLLNEALERRQVDSEILLMVDVLETSLRDTALEWHLTTLETNLSLVARTSLGTFVATGRRTTKPRTGTATDTAA